MTFLPQDIGLFRVLTTPVGGREEIVKKYIRIMRLDHWIKQVFILPGCVAAVFLTHAVFSPGLFKNLFLGSFSTCFIASANYVINEWLDAEFDKFHPTKKNRSVVSEDVNGRIVWAMWVGLTVLGVGTASFVNKPFVFMCIWLWIMGLLYNVKPVRTKDVPILDVLSESINNAIRLLMGWLIVSEVSIPPSSLFLGYWMAGAFLMATKRFAEYRMINDKTLAGNYRKSFRYYTEQSLLITSFCYAMCSVFFIGIFLIKYRVELVLLMPALIGLYGYYYHLSYAADSAVQKPEKLFREKGLMLYCFCLIVLFMLLMIIDIPVLSVFTGSEILPLPFTG